METSEKQEMLSKAINVIRKVVPQAAIYPKEASKIHKLIGKLMFFNKEYLPYFGKLILPVAKVGLGG